MVRLIIKDILLMKKTLLICMAYIVFIIFAFQSMGAGAFATGVTAATYMLVITACAYEDKNRSDIVINSLPIRRQTVVLAKYVSVYVYIALSAVAYGAATAVLPLLKAPITVYPLGIEIFISGVSAATLLSSIFLPIFFKFGYMKSKLVNFILFFSAFAFAGFLGNALMRGGVLENLNKYIVILSQQPDWMFAALIILVIFAIQFVSYQLAVAFYKKREF